MKKRTVRIARIVGLALLLAAAWSAINTFPLWRDSLFGPPVVFLRNRDVELELYPRGHRSVFVLTNDDLNAETSPEAVEKLRLGLKRMGIPATFFVIPFHYGRAFLEEGTPVVEAMRRLRADGHEIAQHGWRHFCPQGAERGREGAEFLYIGLDEQKERLEAGRRILDELGFHPLGHRSPTFGANRLLFRALEEAGYLYGSDVNYPPRTFQTYFVPGHARRILYPFHPRGMSQLQFICQTDPVVRPAKAARLFETYHRRRGVFVALTHLPMLGEEENLQRLERFIEKARARDPWFTTLEEAARWWLAREKTEVKTVRNEEAVEVMVLNPTVYPLPAAVINFAGNLPAGGAYIVKDGAGRILSAGRIPSSRRLEIDVPAGIDTPIPIGPVESDGSDSFKGSETDRTDERLFAKRHAGREKTAPMVIGAECFKTGILPGRDGRTNAEQKESVRHGWHGDRTTGWLRRSRPQSLHNGGRSRRWFRPV